MLLVNVTFCGVGIGRHLGDEAENESRPCDQITFSDGLDKTYFRGTAAAGVKILGQFNLCLVFVNNSIKFFINGTDYRIKLYVLYFCALEEFSFKKKGFAFRRSFLLSRDHR